MNKKKEREKGKNKENCKRIEQDDFNSRCENFYNLDIHVAIPKKKRNEYLQNHYLQDRVESLELPSIRIKKSFGIITFISLSRLTSHRKGKIDITLIRG